MYAFSLLPFFLFFFVFDTEPGIFRFSAEGLAFFAGRWFQVATEGDCKRRRRGGGQADFNSMELRLAQVQKAAARQARGG